MLSSEVDDDDIERNFGSYLSMPKNDDQTVQQAKVSPDGLQETQTSSNFEGDQPHHIYYIETLLIPVIFYRTS